jgi:hypothetical protein
MRLKKPQKQVLQYYNVPSWVWQMELMPQFEWYPKKTMTTRQDNRLGWALAVATSDGPAKLKAKR